MDICDDTKPNMADPTAEINIDSLPYDCLQAIFKRVPMAQLIFLHEVCPHWNTVLTEFLGGYVELSLFKRNHQIMGIDVKTYEKDCLEEEPYPSLGAAEIEMPDFDWNDDQNEAFTRIYNRLPQVFRTANIRKLEICGVSFPTAQQENFLSLLTNLEHLSIHLDNLPYKKSRSIVHHIIQLTTRTHALRHLMISLGDFNRFDININDNELGKLCINKRVLNSLQSFYICDYSNFWGGRNIIKLNTNTLFRNLRHLAVAHNNCFFRYLSRLTSQENIIGAPQHSALLSLTHLTLHHKYLEPITDISLTSFVNLKKLTLSFSTWPNRGELSSFILNYLTSVPASLKHFCLDIVPNTLSFDFFPPNFAANRLPPIQSFETIEIDCGRINDDEVALCGLFDVFKNWSKLRINERHYVADESKLEGYRFSHIAKLPRHNM